MDLPVFQNWFSTALAVICFIGVPALGFLGWIVSGMLDNKRQEKKRAEIEAFRQRGVMAPAIVISARDGMERNVHGRKERQIKYEVDVLPEGRASFRQAFDHWTEKRGFTAVMGQLVGEAGRRIWVTYDPNDPGRMLFEHYDEEHGKIVGEQELDARRMEFNKLTEGNDDLKRRGEQAEAVIVKVDDLNLPYPRKKSRAVHIHFDVMQRNGPAFRAEGDVLIADSALEKYSAGKTVYVRFDPQNPKWAILDSERNRSLK